MTRRSNPSRPWRPLRALAWTCALGLAAACGLRSGTTDEDETGDDTLGPVTDPTEADLREGSCDTPYELPFANLDIPVRGRLLGPGSVRGWCGRDADDEPDAGPEDSYIIRPTFNVDVTVLIPQADFTPSLRVTRDGCREDVLPTVCAAPMGDTPRHFFAEAGHTYTITVDSPEGTDGNYQLQLFYGDPGIDACPVHPTVIDQEPGGYFTWSNGLGARQGQVDGLCGGPGAENMFQLNMFTPGLIGVHVEAEQKFKPVVSIRSGCGGATELTCTSATMAGSNILDLNQFLDPGTYFIVVDQGDVKGGDYKLEVFSN